MATRRVVIDPVTRIEGHLRVEIEAEDGKIAKAWSPCTQFHGLEIVLKDRDPRDAWVFAQRICGVCTSIHALAAIYAVEDALEYPIPAQAKAIRDMIALAQMVQDHVIHFYHLQALDWVNVVNASQGRSGQGRGAGRQPLRLAAQRRRRHDRRSRTRSRALLASGQLSIFTNGYWDHPDYRLPPEADLLALAHYLQALDWQRDMIKVHTIFGGKNPHPNFLVGGMASAINMDNQWTINQVRIDIITDLVDKCLAFVEQVYLPDVLAIGSFYKDYLEIGAANPNMLAVGLPGYAWGRLAQPGGLPGGRAARWQLQRGQAIRDEQDRRVRQLGLVHLQHGQQQRACRRSWVRQPLATPALCRRSTGCPTSPSIRGPRSRATTTMPCRSDPMPRVLVAYARNQPEIKALVDKAIKTLGEPLASLNSTMGRMVGRAIESVYCARQYKAVFESFVDAIKAGQTATFNAARWEPATWPAKAQGIGFVEAPRGTLSHWVNIENGKIANYQAIVPSTWNSSDKDPMGVAGPFAYSLAHTGTHPLVDPAAPLEPLRTIHSFDPCMSCAVHVLDITGAQVTEVKVV